MSNRVRKTSGLIRCCPSAWLQQISWDVHERHFTDKAEAISFYDRNNDDYAYAVGRCWMKTFELKEVK